MNLQERGFEREGRADAEACGAVEDPAVGKMRADGVDAEGGTERVLELEIGGRETDLAAALVAWRDVPLDTPPMAEQARGFVGSARLERAADIGGRDLHAAFGDDRREHRRTEAFHLAHVTEHRGVAAASLAEAEILADHHVGDGELLDQNVEDEIL